MSKPSPHHIGILTSITLQVFNLPKSPVCLCESSPLIDDFHIGRYYIWVYSRVTNCTHALHFTSLHHNARENKWKIYEKIGKRLTLKPL